MSCRGHLLTLKGLCTNLSLYLVFHYRFLSTSSYDTNTFLIKNFFPSDHSYEKPMCSSWEKLFAMKLINCCLHLRTHPDRLDDWRLEKVANEPWCYLNYIMKMTINIVIMTAGMIVMMRIMMKIGKIAIDSWCYLSKWVKIMMMMIIDMILTMMLTADKMSNSKPNWWHDDDKCSDDVWRWGWNWGWWGGWK